MNYKNKLPYKYLWTSLYLRHKIQWNTYGFLQNEFTKKHHTFCFLEGNYVRRWRSDFYLKQIIVTTRFKYWKNLNGYEKSLHPKFICFKIGVLNTKHVVLKYFANFANIHIDRKHPRMKASIQFGAFKTTSMIEIETWPFYQLCSFEY